MQLAGSFARVCLVLAAVAVGVLVCVPNAHVSAQRGLSARVFLTQNRIPNNLSERGLVGFARSHNARRLRETTESALNDREWRAEMVTAFSRPPGDLEYHVLFYDIQGGSRNFVEDMSAFVNDRSQRTFVQRVNLQRPRFKPNRRMELVVTVRRQEVGTLKFDLVGEEQRFSGRVDFTEDDAR